MTAPTTPPRSSAEPVGAVGSGAGGGPEGVGTGTEIGRWRGVILALLAVVFLPTFPQIRAFLPITETTLIVVPGLAACAVIAWLHGGRVWLAAIWVLLAAWTLARSFPPNASPYADLARGWSLLAAGAFAVVSVLSRPMRFLPRALLTLLIAFTATLAVTASRADGVPRVREVLAERLAVRNDAAVTAMRAVLAQSTGRWRNFVASRASPEELGSQLDRISLFGVAYFPALLALETLAGLAVAYALFHRLSRTRIGEGLGPLSRFRFNDQLIWGLVLGLTFAVLPALTAFRGAGRNLLAFFGVLYGLRAVGVLQALWGRTLAIVWVTALLIVLPAVGSVTKLLLLSLLLAIGVTDTWLDWRRRLAR